MLKYLVFYLNNNNNNNKNVGSGTFLYLKPVKKLLAKEFVHIISIANLYFQY